jgi:hypothetical protein
MNHWLSSSHSVCGEAPSSPFAQNPPSINQIAPVDGDMDNKRDFLKTLGVAAGSSLVVTAIGSAIQPASAAPKEKAGATQSGFFGQMQVTANFVRGGRPSGILQLDAGMYSRSEEAQQRANSLMPVFRSRWRSTLQDFVNRYHTAGRVPDAQFLATQLQNVTNEIMGNRSVQVMMVALVAR